MKNDQSNIDNLFAKLDTHSNNTNESLDWELLQPKLRRQNFMRFGVRHFNVYYSAAILLSIIGAALLFSGSRHTQSSSQQINSVQNQPINITAPQSSTKHSLPMPLPTPTSKQTSNTAKQTSTAANSITPQTNTSTELQKQQTTQQDTTPKIVQSIAPIAKPDSTPQHSTSAASQPITNTAQPKAARKIVYQTVTDTIIAVDTIKQEKRKRRGLFSK